MLRILLIEDNPDDALFVEELFSEQSNLLAVELAPAGTLQEGLDQLAGGRPFDLLLLDLSLADSFGLETLERARRAAPEIPIVIMTGLAEESLGLEAIHKGAQDYLIKGQITAPLLARTCRYAVERARTWKEALQRDAHLKLVTEQLPAVLWTTDSQLRFTSSLGAQLHGLDFEPNEIVGKTLHEYFETDDETFFPIVAHHRALAGESTSFDTKWLERTFHAHIEPLRLSGGHIVGTIGVAMDVTEYKRLEHDFRVAREIQQALLPETPPELPGCDLAAACHPADATGGDFFDFIPLPDGRWGLVIGDVSGHGFGPAILTAATHSYLRALVQTQPDVSSMLSVTNRLLIHDTLPEQFVTLAFVQFDPAARTLELHSAGHPAALLLSAEGAVIDKLDALAPPLGWFPGADFAPASQAALEPGQMLLLLTDGLLEALDADRTPFGLDRVIETIGGNAARPARELIAALYEAVHRHTGDQPQADDMTVVLLKVECAP